MAGVNKVILLGNLGQDPEVRHLESGSVVANIRLATTEAYKDKEGNRIENTEWHNIELWDGLAKVAEKYLKQGDTVYIEGKIKTQAWQDNDGNNRKTVKIRANVLNMVSTKQEKKQERASQPQPIQVPQPNPQPKGDIDDLPF